MSLSTLEIAAFLSLCSKSIVDGLAQPVRLKFPALDLWWLLYAAWVLGGLLSYGAGLNLFADYFVSPLIGQAITAIVVGGGSSLLHDLTKRAGA